MHKSDKYILYINIPFCDLAQYTEIMDESIKMTQKWIDNYYSTAFSNMEVGKFIKYNITDIPQNYFTTEVGIWLESKSDNGNNYYPTMDHIIDIVINKIKYCVHDTLGPNIAANVTVNVIAPKSTLHYYDNGELGKNYSGYNYFIPLTLIELDEDKKEGDQ